MKNLIRKMLREIMECPGGMYWCVDDGICKPDSQKMGSIGITSELSEQGTPEDPEFRSDEPEEVSDTEINIPHDVMDSHAQEVQDLKSADETGGWRNPIVDDSPGNVPADSYGGKTYDHKTKRYYKKTIPTLLFFKATELLVREHDHSWFNGWTDAGDALYNRHIDVMTTVKVFGLTTANEGLLDKLFWAGEDNYDGIKSGKITDYDQLYLRPLLEYSVPLYETAREYKTIYWAPKVECYSRDDAYAEVLYDEDGVYDSWEYDGDPSYQEESDEWDADGKELDGDIEVVNTLYPAQDPKSDKPATGNRTSSGTSENDN